MLASILLSVAIAQVGQQKFDPSLLVGTWEANAGSKVKTFTFGGDGKFHSVPKGDGSEFDGTYQLSGDTITIDPHSFTVEIKELGGDKLVVDAAGDVIEFRRKGAGMARGATKGGGFRLGAAPGATGRWAVVKSDKGDFRVEMPGPPNGSGGGGFGGFQESSLSFQDSKMELAVTAIEGPMEVPEDQMAKYLAMLRNRAVERYGKDAKVVSEKPVRAGSLEGQEFVVSLDRMGVGEMNISGRVFARGKASYVLLAIPASKGQSLGPDAQRFLGSFALAGPAGKMASPAPRAPARNAGKGATPSLRKAWGVEIDPDSDVKIRRSDASLTMEIPGTPHVLAPERDAMNAPRILEEARGNFVVSVQVSGAFRPATKSTVKGLSSRQAGGLILWKDDKNYLVFTRRASLDDGKIVNQAVLEELVGGSKGVTIRQPASDAATFLRLGREGKGITAAFSEDGKEWKSLKSVAAGWLDEAVQVGIVGVNTSPTGHSPRFDGYSLKAD